MTVKPIFIRELIALARQGRLPWGRAFFAFVLMASFISLFVIRYYESQSSSVQPRLLGVVAWQSFALVIMIHTFTGIAIGLNAAPSIAREKDRRTLDFLLATRLTNADIVLGKFSAVITQFFTMIAAGVPFMVLLSFLGGIDPRLILLTYAGVISTTFMITCLSIWSSTIANSARIAATTAVGFTGLWFSGPMIIGFLLPKFGISIPFWVSIPNSWVWSSGPISLLMKFAAGMPPFSAVLYAVSTMAWHQVLIGSLFLLAAILQLRSSYRVNTGGDGRGPGRVFRRISWRIRPRPDVSDDPIFWREKYTSRSRGFARFTDVLVHIFLITLLVSSTSYFAWPALVEVWQHGYSSGPSSSEKPDFNIFLWFFMPRSQYATALDQARIDLNVFLRSLSLGIAFFVSLLAPSFAMESISVEQAKETWTGLLTTPLASREILRSKILASLYRIRPVLITLVVLWTIGLIAGAIHPIGFILAALIMASAVWCFLTFGVRCAVYAAGTQPITISSLVMLLTFVGAVPFLLPSRFSSVLIGSLSLPYDIPLALVSYRDIRVTKFNAPYPFLQWLGLNTGEGPIQVLLTILIAILVPAFAAVFFWKQATANFDRLVGRPWKDSSVSRPDPNAIQRPSL